MANLMVTLVKALSRGSAGRCDPTMQHNERRRGQPAVWRGKRQQEALWQVGGGDFSSLLTEHNLTSCLLGCRMCPGDQATARSFLQVFVMPKGTFFNLLEDKRTRGIERFRNRFAKWGQSKGVSP
jgi:hypothetical protein